jgi:sugar/nucleoside kinase (ribokinase family)
MAYDSVCVGDIFIDNFIKISDATLACTLDGDKCKVCFNYGDKIPVDDVETHLGGSSSNVAVGLSRLGLKTALVSALGEDEEGRMALSTLAREGVALDLVERIPEERNNHSFIINFQGERTILGYHRAREYEFRDFGTPTWVYFAFSGRNFESILEGLVSSVGSKNALLGYNPSTYELKGGVDKLRQILSVTHVLFVNKQEAESLVNQSETESPQSLLHKLASYGPKVVVITDGPEGAFVFDGRNIWFIEAYPGNLVERTGTGDGFAAAFIAGLFYESDARQALRWGSVNAASVIQKVGAQPGLLTRRQMEQILSKSSDFQARKIE